MQLQQQIVASLEILWQTQGCITASFFTTFIILQIEKDL
jgi:hypothetical protein